MNCECHQLPKAFNLERLPNRLRRRIEEIDFKDQGWVKLYKCYVCGQRWQLDEWDKYQVVCAIKIPETANWRAYDDKPDRLQLLLDSRGGLSENACVKAGCGNLALKSLAYCPAHAYEIGLRE